MNMNLFPNQNQKFNLLNSPMMKTLLKKNQKLIKFKSKMMMSQLKTKIIPGFKRIMLKNKKINFYLYQNITKKT